MDQQMLMDNPLAGLEDELQQLQEEQQKKQQNEQVKVN
jgi:hypothetical protein